MTPCAVACIYGQQRSLVIDRWGNVRGQTNELPGLVVVEADLNERRQTPWLSSKPGSPWESIYRQERRPGTYGDLTR